ncbi:MAG: hypothetical protein WDA71_13970 [Actinomycetota bacterium]
MRRLPRGWLACLVALGLMLPACGTQRLGRESGGQEAYSPQDAQPSGDTGVGTPLGTVTSGGASALEAPRTQKGSMGASAGAGISPGERTASDRGVTKTEIVLGVLAPDEATLAALGYTYEGKKHEEVMKPFVDEINETGGINGRKLVVKVTRFNSLNQDSMVSGCVQQAEDFKVFASIGLPGLWGDGEVCLSTKETPLVTANASSADTNYRREKGWTRQTQMTKDRMAKNWVDWVIATGRANSKTRNGIIYTDVPEDRQVVNDVFIPYMKHRGLQVTEVAALSYPGSSSPDASASQAETQASALKFKARDVELVWPATNWLQMYLWVQQADSTQYKPKYTVSDVSGMTSGYTTIYPPSQWNGVTGVTVAREGEVPAGVLPKDQAFKECEAVYKAHGQKVAPDPNNAAQLDETEMTNLALYCEHIALFAEVAKRAGANPARRSFLAAFDGLGTWARRVAITEKISFAKNKYDGADYIAVVKWQTGCGSYNGCYVQVEGFRKGTW